MEIHHQWGTSAKRREVAISSDRKDGGYETEFDINNN